ncbi:MAG: transketolase family protein [Synergistaceae bacterium]|jgi:transketolase|nr:transketolase family protein [Synergistaceae bacterium]
MDIKFAQENKTDAKEMRAAYCETLIEMAERNENVVVLDADLMSAMGMKPFQAKFPERAVDCGVQEANMIGVAAGLSAVGKIPFAHSFAPFITRRACDQIFISAAYARLNVKLIGSDPGITAALNGGTHMPFEDMGIMRLFPTMTALEPTDTAMLKDILNQIVDLYGMFYLRFVRKNVIQIYEQGSHFSIGKAVQLRDGRDVTVIASGYCVSEALRAADDLRSQGISARVLDMFTWKPIDVEAVAAAAKETGALVTAENHNVIGGLGSAVADALVETSPAPMEKVGVQDEFGEVGPVKYLAERYGLTASHIAEAVKKVLKRKTR